MLRSWSRHSGAPGRPRGEVFRELVKLEMENCAKNAKLWWAKEKEDVRRTDWPSGDSYSGVKWCT